MLVLAVGQMSLTAHVGAGRVESGSVRVQDVTAEEYDVSVGVAEGERRYATKE